MENKNNGYGHPNSEPNKANVSSGSALDRSFPSPLILGGLILLIIIFTILFGWKIVNLEHERAVLETERRVLERDKIQFEKNKKAYAEILDRSSLSRKAVSY